ncbi:unnamed protein product [marine sediment metagenome]|uniref:Uncharacterized protein n=1 Tax=marine sediment metagenome TaxID=412755 RepID=X1FEC5_9ZZZZ
MKYNAENDEQSEYVSLKSEPQELSPEMKKLLDELCEQTKKRKTTLSSTKKDLIESANKLLGCFVNIDRWPKIMVSFNGEWVSCSVDDTTRDAIRHLGKLTGSIK